MALTAMVHSLNPAFSNGIEPVPLLFNTGYLLFPGQVSVFAALAQDTLEGSRGVYLQALERYVRSNQGPHVAVVRSAILNDMNHTFIPNRRED